MERGDLYEKICKVKVAKKILTLKTNISQPHTNIPIYGVKEIMVICALCGWTKYFMNNQNLLTITISDFMLTKIFSK